MLGPREKQMFLERSGRLESIQENLKEASSNVEALRLEREKLKESLKIAFIKSSGEREEKCWKKIEEMDFKIESIEKIVKNNRTDNEKVGYSKAVHEAGKKQRVLEDSFDEVHSALTDSVYRLIEKINLSPFKSQFKTHFICSRRLKSNLENRKYREVLLNLFDFTLSVIDYLAENLSSTDSCQTKNYQVPIKLDTGSAGFSNTQKRFKNSNEISDVYKPTSKFSDTENYTQTCWTQTGPVLNGASQTAKGSQTIEKPSGNQLKKQLKNIGIQSDHYSVKPNIETRSLILKSALRDKRQPSSGYLQETSNDKVNMLIESRMTNKNNEDISKLFDESQQLLSIIDKQNSRLAKINSQILELSPNTEELEDDYSTDSHKKTERLKYRHKPNREQEWKINITQKPPQHSAHSSENLKQAKKFSEKPEENNLRKITQSPEGNSSLRPESKLSIEYHRSSSKLEYPKKNENGRIIRYSANEISDDFDSIRAPAERKKNDFESSALRIPSIDGSGINEGEFQEIPSPKLMSPKSYNRVFSPDQNANRFGGYVRPFLREEKRWEGAWQYFSYQN